MRKCLWYYYNLIYKCLSYWPWSNAFKVVLGSVTVVIFHNDGGFLHLLDDFTGGDESGTFGNQCFTDHGTIYSSRCKAFVFPPANFLLARRKKKEVVTVWNRLQKICSELFRSFFSLDILCPAFISAIIIYNLISYTKRCQSLFTKIKNLVKNTEWALVHTLEDRKIFLTTF